MVDDSFSLTSLPWLLVREYFFSDVIGSTSEIGNCNNWAGY